MDSTRETVFIAYIQQPAPQSGIAAVEAFAERGDAVAFLRREYERFLSAVPGARTREWCANPDDPLVAAGVVDAGFTNWHGRVVERPVRRAACEGESRPGTSAGAPQGAADAREAGE